MKASENLLRRLEDERADLKVAHEGYSEDVRNRSYWSRVIVQCEGSIARLEGVLYASL